jgi:hypothetical protein
MDELRIKLDEQLERKRRYKKQNEQTTEQEHQDRLLSDNQDNNVAVVEAETEEEEEEGVVEHVMDMDDVIQSMLDRHQTESIQLETESLNSIHLSEEYQKGVEDTKQKMDSSLIHCKNTIKYLEMDLRKVCGYLRNIDRMISSVSNNKRVIPGCLRVVCVESKENITHIKEMYEKRGYKDE